MNRRFTQLIRRPGARGSELIFQAEASATGSNVEAELIAESIMWFDAAKGVTLSGAYLQLWNDQSPRGMIASRSAATIINNTAEYLLTGGVGGEPAIRMFAGELLVTGSMFDLATNPTVDDVTFYIVHNNISPSGNVNSSSFHFDQLGATGLNQARRIIYQQNGANKRPGVAISGTVNVYGPGFNWDAFATGSQCMTYIFSGTRASTAQDFTAPRPMWFRGRGLWGSSNAINSQSVSGTFSNGRFALAGDNSGNSPTVRAMAEYSLFIAFSGSHNSIQRQKVWDYIEGRFGVCNSTTEYAFTSGTMPYSETSGSVIPASLVDPRFWNGNFKIRVKLGTNYLTQQQTIFSIGGNSGNQRLISVAGVGSVRWYPDTGGTFLTLGSLTGSLEGDIVEFVLPNKFAIPGLLNTTQNIALHNSIGTVQLNQNTGSLQWLLQGVGATQGLSGSGWEVWAPEFIKYDSE